MAILLSGGAVALAQQSAPRLPNTDQLFKLPPLKGLNHPHFNFESPNRGRQTLVPPHRLLVQPPSALASSPKVDPEMIIHPPQGSFADRQPRPALSGNLYPNLMILPTEMAQLELGQSPWPTPRGIPIPTTWPEAEFEQIPTTWDKFTLMPVRAGSDAVQSVAGK